ncbi:signal transduction histidine kinase/ActR/RegA family two-component response regulator [Pedobacter sp. UYEF25]
MDKSSLDQHRSDYPILSSRFVLMSILFAIIFISLNYCAQAQYVFKNGVHPDEVSILEYASILNTGQEELSFAQIRKTEDILKFKKLKGPYGNLGFTSSNYWLKFQLKNELETPVFYYLRTAEPTTENVDLYLVDKNGQFSTQKSGNNLDFSERSVKYRRTLFEIHLAPGETKSAFMLLKNDGRKNRLPLEIISQKQLLQTAYSNQFFFGFFYGILFIIVLTYLFFYVALKETSFLYYSLYVFFAALCQFSLDGFYHQYIATGHSWLSLNMVILSAICGCFFFGKYSQWILDVEHKNRLLHKLFNGFYLVLGLILMLLLLFPTFSIYSFPIVSVWVIVGVVLLYLGIILLILKKQRLDFFYILGMLVLTFTMIYAVLMNFKVLPASFLIENITKQGICLQMIAFSLSMANRIRLMKKKEQITQELALQRSEEMNNVKSYFLSNMSHELRTPLNAILGLAGVMAKENIDPDLKRNYESIRYASQGLISSVNDILDFSRMEEGTLKLDHWEFTPKDVITKFLESAAIQCADKNLIFEENVSLNDSTVVLGDAVRLEQIIHNLLGNAIKFTNSGKVTLIVTSTIKGSDLNLKIVVKDTGIGIAEKKLESIFGIFSQTDFDNKRKHGGFGVGLSIARALTNLHKGTLKIDSKVNEGTVCELNIKYKIPEVAAAFVNHFPDIDFDLLGTTVLVVEDNPLNQMVVQMLLESWKGTTVVLANDGSEGLNILKTQNIDIVLMDLQMPVMDGYEAIAAIRGNLAGEKNTTIPIIVVTADITQPTKDRVFDLGADGYMTKPVDEKTMYQKITVLLSICRSKQMLIT